MTADIGSSELAEFLAAFFAKFEANQWLLVLPHLFLGVFQIFTGELHIAFFVFELKDSSLTDGFDGFLRILFARELDDDAVRPFALNDRFREAHFIDTLLHDIDDLGNGFRCHLILCGVFGLHDDVRAALKVEPLANMSRQPAYRAQEDGDDSCNDYPETDQCAASDTATLFLFQNFNPFS